MREKKDYISFSLFIYYKIMHRQIKKINYELIFYFFFHRNLGGINFSSLVKLVPHLNARISANGCLPMAKGDILILRVSINSTVNTKEINYGPIETSRRERHASQAKPNSTKRLCQQLLTIVREVASCCEWTCDREQPQSVSLMVDLSECVSFFFLLPVFFSFFLFLGIFSNLNSFPSSIDTLE